MGDNIDYKCCFVYVVVPSHEVVGGLPGREEVPVVVVLEPATRIKVGPPLLIMMAWGEYTV